MIEKIIINKFNIIKKKGLYKHINKVHQWSEGLLVIGIFLMVFSNSYELRLYYTLIGLTVLLGFRGFMEWKFEKESKTFLLNILSSIATLLLLIILKLFF